MPDPIARAVDHWYEFTFRQRRDAVVFADELFSEVSRFMNKLLDAFSQAVPVRFRGA